MWLDGVVVDHRPAFSPYLFLCRSRAVPVGLGKMMRKVGRPDGWVFALSTCSLSLVVVVVVSACVGRALVAGDHDLFGWIFFSFIFFGFLENRSQEWTTNDNDDYDVERRR